MRMLAALVLIAACEPAPAPSQPAVLDCVSFRDEDTLPSMTQTFSVAVDAARGRAYATGLGLPWVSAIDLEQGRRTAAWAYAERSTGLPYVAVDGAGVVWVASNTAPTLVRVHPESGAVRSVAGLGEQRWVVGLDAGVLVAVDGYATRLDGEGRVVATATFPGARAGARHPDGVVVLGDSGAAVLDADTLVERARCPLPFAAAEVAALDDGTLWVAGPTRVARLRCEPDAVAQEWALGREILALAGDGAQVLAVDRVGPDDPTRGVAWALPAVGEPGLALVTAKNTASGAFAADGTFWGNAEGSSEVVGWRLADGAVVAEVSTGTSVADLLVDDAGTVYGTGRLSALVGRVQDGELQRAEPLVWPWAPRLDGDRLVLLDHLLGQLVTLDAQTLAERSRLDLGVAPNELLTFDSLAPAPDRGTWLVAESQADLLLEVDLDAGEVRHRWPLGGPPVDEPDLAAQLELHYLGEGVAFLARTGDGRLTRVELDTGALAEGWLEEEALAELRDRRLTRASLLDGDALWLGPHRLDPWSFARTDTWAHVEALLSPWPAAPDEWLAMSADGLALQHLAADGEVLSSYAWFAERQPGSVAAVEGEDAVWVNRSYEGRACRVPVPRLVEGRALPPD